MKWIIEWVSMDWIEVAVSVGRWRLRRCSRPDPPLRRCRRSTPWAPSGRLRRRRRQRIRLPPPVVAKYSTDIITEKKTHAPFHWLRPHSASIPSDGISPPFRFHSFSFSLSLCLSFIFDLLLLKIISIVAIFSIRIRFSSFFLLFSVFWLFCCPSDWNSIAIGLWNESAAATSTGMKSISPSPKPIPSESIPACGSRRQTDGLEWGIGRGGREGRERGEGERGGRKSDGYLIGTADGMHGIRAGIGGTGVGAAWAAVRLGSHHSDAVDFAAARSVHRQHRVAMLSAALLSALLSAALLSAALLSAWSALLMGLSSINKLTNESISNLYIIFVIFLHFNS